MKKVCVNYALLKIKLQTAVLKSPKAKPNTKKVYQNIMTVNLNLPKPKNNLTL